MQKVARSNRHSATVGFGHRVGGSASRTRIVQLGFLWLTPFRFAWIGTAAGNATLQKATKYAEICQKAESTHRLNSTASGLEGFATVLEVWVG